MKPNRMKQRIAGGRPALGCSVMFPSPQIVEMLGHAGFDWVLIDCEHGSAGLADVELMAIACDAVGITPIGRPKTNAASDIQAMMDRGVAGVQVPHVNSAGEARRAVAAVKFGPGAARGLAAGTRPDSWGLGARMPDFTEAANAQSLVCVQIEHAEAIDEALTRILAAGRTPGMPATSETVAQVLAKGCRYVYTHLPRLVGAGAAAFLEAGRRER
jgi:4-hydroxy-2-oxoheptanedioate aldolase